MQLLMDRWRAARDGGPKLSESELAELNCLVQQEWEGAARRTAALVQGPRE
jgi:hypothetical protein